MADIETYKKALENVEVIMDEWMGIYKDIYVITEKDFALHVPDHNVDLV